VAASAHSENLLADRNGWLEVLLGLLIAAAVGLELRLLFTLNVNWDEFHFLSRIYEVRRDALPQLLQTFHVHLFGWLSQISTHEMDQIFAARTVLFGLGLGSRALLYGVARRFLGVPGALMAVLAWSCFSYVLHHGASFRFDPMLSFLVLLAIFLLLAKERSSLSAAAAGAAVALAMMISLKTAFQLPTLAAVLGYGTLRAEPGLSRLRQGLIFGATGLVVFGALYALHASWVVVTAGTGDSGTFLQRVATSFLSADLFPRADYLIQTLRWDWSFWLLLGVGMVLCTRKLVRAPHGERGSAALLLSFALPLLSLALYRNAFPYFYVLVLAPAVVLSGVPVEALLRHRSLARSARIGVAALIGLLVFLGALRFGWAHREDETLAQRELIDLVHELFPVATPYIDRCAMIATYPKAGMFISEWGLGDYRAEGEPVMEELIRAEQPLFVLANVAALNVSPERVEKTAPRDRLLEADRRAIRENYIWHWSKLAVAGKSFAFERGEGGRSFRILIPGTYTLEASNMVRIDGELVQPRSRVKLDTGGHSITSLTTPARVSLRWGDALRRPQHAPADQSIFTGFHYGK
jgi:hypothetical protein